MRVLVVSPAIAPFVDADSGTLSDHDPELARVRRDRQHVGNGDQRFAGDTIGQDGRTADAIAVDQGDTRPVLRGHEGGFISARATPDDNDSGHGLIVPCPAATVAGAGQPTVVSTIFLRTTTGSPEPASGF